jgi:hypothetical protein
MSNVLKMCDVEKAREDRRVGEGRERCGDVAVILEEVLYSGDPCTFAI